MVARTAALTERRPVDYPSECALSTAQCPGFCSVAIVREVLNNDDLSSRDFLTPEPGMSLQMAKITGADGAQPLTQTRDRSKRMQQKSNRSQCKYEVKKYVHVGSTRHQVEKADRRCDEPQPDKKFDGYRIHRNKTTMTDGSGWTFGRRSNVSVKWPYSGTGGGCQMGEFGRWLLNISASQVLS